MERFFRNRPKRMIAGVCSGLSDYFNIDVVLVRIVFILAVFTGGLGIIAYILLWIVADYGVVVRREVISGTPRNSRNVLAYILISLGVLFLLDYIIPDIDSQIYFALILLGLGTALLYKNIKSENQIGERNI